MAITLVSSVTSSQDSGMSIDVAVPSGVVAGDLLVVCHSDQVSTAQTPTIPSGWTRRTPYAGITSDGRLTGIYTKTATGSEPASYNFARTGAATRSIAVMMCFRGVDTSSPVDAVVTDYDGTPSGNGRYTENMTATAGSMYVFFAALEHINTQSHVPSATPSGFTLVSNWQTGSGTTGSRTGGWVGIRTESGGATGTPTISYTTIGGALRAQALVLRAVAGTAPDITTTSLNTLTEGVSFSQTLSATGDTPITWATTSGSLPSGLSLNTSTGSITGTPSAAGSYSFTITATNSYGSDPQAYTGTVNSAVTAPTITTTTLDSLTQGVSFSQILAATGTSPFTWSVSSGTLPTGLSLNTSTGAITGTPSGSGAYSFTVTATNSAGSDPQAYSGTIATISLPTVTGAGFGTVTKMLQTFGATWAHRNLGGTYPEMTEYGCRMAANAGYGIIEISLQRTSDGVLIGSHDGTPDRVAVETTYDGTNFASLTSTQVLGLTANVGSTGAPQPFATLAQLVNTLPSDFIFLVDNKPGSYMTEFLDQLDTLGGPSRFIVKIDGAATYTRFQAARQRGYLTAAYFYDNTSSAKIIENMNATVTISGQTIPAVTLPGLNYQAAQSYWDDLLAYGRPIWGHVCLTQANADMAMAKGATFIQSTSTSITAVGVSAWRPGITSGFAPKEIKIGTQNVSKVYIGTQNVWTR